MVEILSWLILLGADGPFKWVALLITLAAYLIVVWLTVSATWRWLGEHRYRYLAVALELTVLLILPAGYVTNHRSQKQQAVDTKRATMTKALNRYQELCKGAGEKIYRTVEGVDGVFLMKIDLDASTGVSQYSIDAKSPYESLGDFDRSGLYKNNHAVGYMSFDGYIASYLRDKTIADWVPVDDAKKIKTRPAFRYIEAIDPLDGKRYRYTGSWQKVDKNDREKWRRLIREMSYIPREMLEPVNFNDGGPFKFILTREPVSNPPPRYGVTYDDLETPEERQMWIAGTSLKVVDLQTGELLGQRVGFLHDRGGGSAAAYRQPWSFAKTEPGWSCPGWFSPANNKTGFIFRILHPKQAETP
jgi:hypothetical protein